MKRGGQDFVLAGRDEQAAQAIVAGLGGHAEAVSVDEAVDRAGVLVPAVWLDDFRQFIARYGVHLVGKVVIDPTNSVGPDGPAGTARSSASRSPRARSWPGCCRPGPGWSRRSARCRPLRWPRPPGRSPTGRCCSTPPGTTPPGT